MFSLYSGIMALYKILLLTKFEPQTSGIDNDRSANWTTTIAQLLKDAVLVATFFGVLPKPGLVASNGKSLSASMKYGGIELVAKDISFERRKDD